MERLILESLFILGIISLILIYIKLFKNVVMLRRQHKIDLGSGKSIELKRAIRAHSNFNENVPLAVLLLMFLYFHNLLIICNISILLLTVGRILHFRGILDLSEKKTSYTFRIKGMKLTLYSFYVSIFGLFFFLSQTFYFYLKNFN